MNLFNNFQTKSKEVIFKLYQLHRISLSSVWMGFSFIFLLFILAVLIGEFHYMDNFNLIFEPSDDIRYALDDNFYLTFFPFTLFIFLFFGFHYFPFYFLIYLKYYIDIRYSRYYSSYILQYEFNRRYPKSIFYVRNFRGLKRIYLESHSSSLPSDNFIYKIVFDSIGCNSNNKFYRNLRNNFQLTLIENTEKHRYNLDYIFEKMGDNRFFCLEQSKISFSKPSFTSFIKENLFLVNEETKYIFLTEYEFYFLFKPAPVYIKESED
jgi:hypothetical protein